MALVDARRSASSIEVGTILQGKRSQRVPCRQTNARWRAKRALVPRDEMRRCCVLECRNVSFPPLIGKKLSWQKIRLAALSISLSEPIGTPVRKNGEDDQSSPHDAAKRNGLMDFVRASRSFWSISFCSENLAWPSAPSLPFPSSPSFEAMLFFEIWSSTAACLAIHVLALSFGPRGEARLYRK